MRSQSTDADSGRDLYRRSGTEVMSGTREQVEALFGEFDLLEPGVVWVPKRHPGSTNDVGDSAEASRSAPHQPQS